MSAILEDFSKVCDLSEAPAITRMISDMEIFAEEHKKTLEPFMAHNANISALSKSLINPVLQREITRHMNTIRSLTRVTRKQKLWLFIKSKRDAHYPTSSLQVITFFQDLLTFIEEWIAEEVNRLRKLKEPDIENLYTHSYRTHAPPALASVCSRLSGIRRGALSSV